MCIYIIINPFPIVYDLQNRNFLDRSLHLIGLTVDYPTLEQLYITMGMASRVSTTENGPSSFYSTWLFTYEKGHLNR